MRKNIVICIISLVAILAISYVFYQRAELKNIAAGENFNAQQVQKLTQQIAELNGQNQELITLFNNQVNLYNGMIELYNTTNERVGFEQNLRVQWENYFNSLDAK